MNGGTERILLTMTFLGALIAFYALTFSYRAITDTELNSLQTRAFVLHGDVDLDRYGKLPGIEGQYARRGDHVYSVYGAGITVVAAPVYLVLARLGASENLLQGAVGVLFAAGAVVVLHRVLLRLAPAAIAAAATVVFAFGTTMWTVAAMALFQQGPMVFFQCLGLVGLFSKRPNGPLLSGLGFGIATFIRVTAGIPLLLLGILHLTEGRRKALLYSLGAALPIIGILVQNRWLWGTWLTGGYAYHPIGFHADMRRALFGLLLGLWRGLLVYSPILILGFAGALVAVRRRSGFVERRLLFLAGSTVATILFYSKWTVWWGGLNQFGYRLLLEVVPFLVVLGTYAVVRIERLKPIAVLLGGLSILTMTWGAAPSRGGWDGMLLASRLVDTSLGQSWIVFLDRPLGGIARLAGVAIVGALILFASRRFSSMAGSTTLEHARAAG